MKNTTYLISALLLGASVAANAQSERTAIGSNTVLFAGTPTCVPGSFTDATSVGFYGFNGGANSGFANPDWQMNGQTSIGSYGVTDGYTYTGGESLSSCVTVGDLDVVGAFNGFSVNGAEGSPNGIAGFNGRCISGWNTGEYLTFDINLDSSASGFLRGLSFYEATSSQFAGGGLVGKFDLEVSLNNQVIFSALNQDTTEATSIGHADQWGYHEYDFNPNGTIGNDLTITGGETYTVKITPQELQGTSADMWGFDGINILGDCISCSVVPEPSAALLGAIAGFGFLLRRRR